MNEGFGFKPPTTSPEAKARHADRKARQRELTRLRREREKDYIKVRTLNEGFGIECPTSPEMKARIEDREARKKELANKKRERIQRWVKKHCAK